MYGRLLTQFLIAGAATFILTVILAHYIIPVLRGHKVGQSIRPEGPSWHRSKAGTPTMGGICFIMAMLIVLAGVTVYYAARREQRELIPMALTLGLAVFNGLIGFVDDYCKLLKKMNEGLKAYQKFILQLLVAALYIFALKVTGYLDTVLHIPFTDIDVELGIVYYIFALFLITGMVNSVNLTDGIDGLAATVTLVISCFFAFVAFNMASIPLALISGAMIGGMVGFLIYNLHPARVFMGDTGSLFLGGIVTGAAFLINNPLIIVIAGGVYVIEALSDIIQVVSFKLRAKRVFKMAPIHHHFEKCGWKEGKIVAVFSIVTVLLCVAAWFGL
ncbi:MAG: phospho-N-acetylmuramoyl-pentapeptide-transferase [Eubacteriales bacterium]